MKPLAVQHGDVCLVERDGLHSWEPRIRCWSAHLSLSNNQIQDKNGRANDQLHTRAASGQSTTGQKIEIRVKNRTISRQSLRSSPRRGGVAGTIDGITNAVTFGPARAVSLSSASSMRRRFRADSSCCPCPSWLWSLPLLDVMDCKAVCSCVASCWGCASPPGNDSPSKPCACRAERASGSRVQKRAMSPTVCRVSTRRTRHPHLKLVGRHSALKRPKQINQALDMVCG